MKTIPTERLNTLSRAEEARRRALEAASDAGHAIGKFVVGTHEVDEEHVDAALEVVTQNLGALVHLKKNRKHPAVRLMLKQRMALAAELVMAFVRTTSKGATQPPLRVPKVLPTPPGIAVAQSRDTHSDSGTEIFGRRDSSRGCSR